MGRKRDENVSRLARGLQILILLAVTAAGLAPNPVMAQQSNDDAAWLGTEKAASTAPVTIDGRLLFRVFGVTSFPAGKRAQAIADRIIALAEDRSESTDSLRLVEAEHSTDILAGDQLIMSVVNADARIEGGDNPRRLIAQVHLNRIKAAVADYRVERNPALLLHNAIIAADYTLLLAVTLFVIFFTVRWVARGIERRYQSAVKKIETGSFQLVSAASIWKLIHIAFRILSLLLALFLVLLDLHFVLSLFPWTRGVADNFRALALAPVFWILSELEATAPGLLVIALIVSAARYMLKVARGGFTAIKERRFRISGFDPDWSDPTYNIVRVLIIAFAVVVSYPYIPGSESPAFKGVTIFIGVLFSLGSSAFLANLIAGYTMTYRRAFHPGDRIKVGDLMGDVTAIGLMVTHLRSVKNEELVVPNSLILNSNLINYSSLAREHGLILHTTVGIGYETPWRQVEAMLLMAAERTPAVLREPPPYILQKSLEDFAVTYELNVYCDRPLAMYELYTELHRNILDVFNEFGVQIMTPSYVADPAAPKVVPKDQWFAGPAQAPPLRKTGST
jgi:small-conductance mechanosensitive channel